MAPLVMSLATILFGADGCTHRPSDRPRLEDVDIRETTAADEEVRGLIATASTSPLSRPEFDAPPTTGPMHVMRRSQRAMVGHWSGIEVTLIASDEHGSHEWNFTNPNGQLRLVCESQTVFGPSVWKFKEGPAREKVFFMSGTGGACVAGSGFRTLHLTAAGMEQVPVDRAVALAREWRGRAPENGRSLQDGVR
jgi:hypothetical protein